MDHTVALIEIFDVLRKMTIIITLWGFVTYFNAHLTAQVKMSLGRAPKHNYLCRRTQTVVLLDKILVLRKTALP